MGRKQWLKKIVYSFLEKKKEFVPVVRGGGGIKSCLDRTWIRPQLRVCEHQPLPFWKTLRSSWFLGLCWSVTGTQTVSGVVAHMPSPRHSHTISLFLRVSRLWGRVSYMFCLNFRFPMHKFHLTHKGSQFQLWVRWVSTPQPGSPTECSNKTWTEYTKQLFEESEK